MRQRRTWLNTLLTLTYLTLASVAYGQAEAPAGDQARKQASERFQRGVELYQEGAFRAALVEFERAYGIAPDYRLLYNIGQVKLQLQDYLGATQSYERYLAEGGADIPRARRDDVEEAFETLRQRVGRISVTTNRDGAELFIDDGKVGIAPMAATVAVNVGRHRVYARSDDGANATQVVDIAGGDLVDVKLELKAPDLKSLVVVKTSEPFSTMKQAAIAGWAVGGVALIGAGATAFLASGKVDDRNKELENTLPDAGKVNDLKKSANTFALTTDILAVVAILGAGAGTTLWFLDSSSKASKKDGAPKKKASSSVHWSVGATSVTASGRF